jgi:hypothetical protein
MILRLTAAATKAMWWFHQKTFALIEAKYPLRRHANCKIACCRYL